MSGGRRGWIRLIAAAFRGRIRYRITRSGYLFASALVLVGVSAVVSANNLLFLILAAMLATILISGFVSRLSLAGLEVELILPEHIAARQSVTAKLRLRNVKWFPSFALQLSGRPGASAQILQRDIVFPAIAGRASVEAEAPALFSRRGPHQESLFVVSTRFPFGFMERRALISIRSEVVIYPALAGSLLAEELRQDLKGELERERRGLGSDFYRIRPYEYSESARHLDWKSSAHTRELQVREFAREERSTIHVFFDLRGEAGEGFESRLECCAYLVWTLSEESVRIRFRTQEADLLFPEQVSVYEILRELALAQPLATTAMPLPDGDDPAVLFSDYAESFEAAGWQPGRVITTDAIAPARAATLL